MIEIVESIKSNINVDSVHFRRVSKHAAMDTKTLEQYYYQHYSQFLMQRLLYPVSGPL